MPNYLLACKIRFGHEMVWLYKIFIDISKNNLTVLFLLCELIRTIDRALDVNTMSKFVRLQKDYLLKNHLFIG